MVFNSKQCFQGRRKDRIRDKRVKVLCFTSGVPYSTAWVGLSVVSVIVSMRRIYCSALNFEPDLHFRKQFQFACASLSFLVRVVTYGLFFTKQACLYVCVCVALRFSL